MAEVSQAANWYVHWTIALMALAAKNFEAAGKTMPEGYEANNGDICAKTLLEYLVGQNRFMTMGPTQDELFGTLLIPSYEAGRLMERIIDMGGEFRSLLEDEDPGQGLLAYRFHLKKRREEGVDPQSPSQVAYGELSEIITLLGAEVPETESHNVRELASFLREAYASLRS